MRENPWLVQRLTVPLEVKKNAFPNTKIQVLKDGNFTEEYLKIREYLFGYDYMGSAEFEFGALPKAVKNIIENRPIQITLTLKGLDSKEYYLYVICSESNKEIALEQIKNLFQPWVDKAHLKPVSESIWNRINVPSNQDLKEVLMYKNEFAKEPKERKYVGWLCVDEHRNANNWFAFIDKKTAHNFYSLIS